MTSVVGLAVSEVRPETDEVSTIVFDDRDRWVGGRAGQHIVLHVRIDDVEHRRVYSLSSSPELGEQPAITVKRLSGGTVSPFLVERIGPGDVIDVEPAAGVFTLDVGADNRRTYYGFIAGSGSVPVLSMTKSILAREPESNVHLAYGNRRKEDVIFSEALAALGEQYPGRLSLTHALSSEGSRIDHRFVNDFLMGHPPASLDVRYLVSGPPGMRDGVVARLASLGVLDAHVLVEHYLPPTRSDGPEPYDGAIVSDLTSGVSAAIPAGETVLTGMASAGAPVEWACQSGVCGTCRAKLISGEVDPGFPFVLTEQDRTDGFILTCIARPVSPEVVVDLG